MARIELLETFEVGHAGIDADHRQLVAIINDISDAIDDDRMTECRGLLESFLDVAAQHFRTEEGLLSEIGFPRIGEHSAYHAELLMRATAIKEMCAGLTETTKLRQCFEDLARFMVDDIVRGDLDFKSFLEANGLVRRKF